MRAGNSIDPRTPSAWRRALASYQSPGALRSWAEVSASLGALVALWFIRWNLPDGAIVLSLALAVPSAGFVLRLFSIQHDCGHLSFFRSGVANNTVGRFLSLVSLVPYSYWRDAHAQHHATTGELDGRGIGDVGLFTVREYLEASRFGRLRYRLYRNPLFLFTVGPIYLFYLRFRLPAALPVAKKRATTSILLTNLSLLAVLGMIYWKLDLVRFVWLYLPMMTLAAMAGTWLFYVHHQFEHTYWENTAEWSPLTAALHGSSYYALPAWMQWFVGNTGIHHIHHLNSRIPNYRLPECLNDFPELREIGRMTLTESLRCGRLALWDERSRKLVSFANARRLPLHEPSDVEMGTSAGIHTLGGLARGVGVPTPSQPSSSLRPSG